MLPSGPDLHQKFLAEISAILPLMPAKTCSICTAPADVLAAIDRELCKPDGERLRLRDLAKKSGFSRAALSRHSIKHVNRRVFMGHHSNRFDPTRDLIFIQWPGQGPLLEGAGEEYGGPWPLRTTPNENDVIITVRYSPAVPERPAKVLQSEELPEEQTPETAS